MINTFLQLVRTSKPTGDADCPPHVLRAQYIEELINDKVGSRELDDSEIVDVYEDDVIELRYVNLYFSLPSFSHTNLQVATRKTIYPYHQRRHPQMLSLIRLTPW